MLCGQNQGLYTDTKRILKIENAFKECSCTPAAIEKCKPVPQLHISRWASPLNAIQLNKQEIRQFAEEIMKKILYVGNMLVYLHHTGLYFTLDMSGQQEPVLLLYMFT